MCLNSTTKCKVSCLLSQPDWSCKGSPGFPQAEQLMYPKDTCTQIAVLLRESNACYPEGMRSMTGLDVGWLLRA